jgi:hypothetical protein
VQLHCRQPPAHGEGVRGAHTPPPLAASCKASGHNLPARSRMATPPRLYATAPRTTPRSPLRGARAGRAYRLVLGQAIACGAARQRGGGISVKGLRKKEGGR